jgi:hypothetical protein
VTQAPPPALKRRDGDLDWIKGIACIFMLMLHAVVLVGVPNHGKLWTIQFQVIHQFYAWFFMASGMNVWRSVSRDIGRDWKVTTTGYLSMTLMLFGLGIIYSINRRMLWQMELFQGVAACTAISYLVLRRQWPNWALVAISVLLFGATADWGYSYYGKLSPETLDVLMQRLFDPTTWREYPLIINARALAFPINDPVMRQTVFDQFHKMYNLLIVYEYSWWQRFLFVHFSLLPWVSWFILGGVLMRMAGGKNEKYLWILLIGFLGLSFYPPYYVPRIQMDFFFRGKIDFLLWSSGIAGISILLARRYYRSERKINKAIEFIGRESFLIFILQWLFVDFICLPLGLWGDRTGSATWKLFPLLQVGTVVVTYFLTRFFAGRRDANVKKTSYLRFWSVFTLAFTIAAGATYNSRPILSWLLSYPLIIGVGMVFPALRLVLQRVLMPKKMPKPAEATGPERK